MLKQYKIITLTPTCFGSRRNHHQGTILCLAKTIKHVEIKCQLYATEVFIADLIACSKCFVHHYAHHQELKSIIQWLLPVVFRVVVFKFLVWCGA